MYLVHACAQLGKLNSGQVTSHLAAVAFPIYLSYSEQFLSIIMPRGRAIRTRRSRRPSMVANTLAAAAGRSPITPRGRGARATATGRGCGADRGRGAGRGADRGRGTGPSRPGATTASSPPTPLESESEADVETDSGILLGPVREAVQQILAESGHIADTGSENTPTSDTLRNIVFFFLGVYKVLLCPYTLF